MTLNPAESLALQSEQVDSPFLKQPQVRLAFSTMIILLLMVVSAGVGLLVYYALRVPAITSEINAWWGRPEAVVDRAEAREAQVIFALCLYIAPLALGMFVYVLHFAINWIDRMTRARRHQSDEEFQME